MRSLTIVSVEIKFIVKGLGFVMSAKKSERCIIDELGTEKVNILN
jgi:hypothetical protein